jgi:DeoR/GlpR family transcriptional regulator of sugar metabolism
MIASARSVYIINRLNESGIIDYKSIAAELEISEATVRRDFEKLENQGKLKRVQGGAMLSENMDELLGKAELTMVTKRGLNSLEKLAAAKAAFSRVKDGECVFLDSGTSIEPLADLLITKKVQIVTYNSLVLHRLADIPAELFVIGGKYMPMDKMFVGPIAENMLRNYHFDHAFIGCSGLDLPSDTVFTTEMECMRMKQIAMSSASRNYLLVDASKLQKKGVFRFAGIGQFDTVYCCPPPANVKLPANFEVVDIK